MLLPGCFDEILKAFNKPIAATTNTTAQSGVFRQQGFAEGEEGILSVVGQAVDNNRQEADAAAAAAGSTYQSELVVAGE